MVAVLFDLDGSSGSFLIAGWRSERVAGSLSGSLLGWSSRYDRREAKYGSSSLVIETVVMVRKDMLICCCFLDTLCMQVCFLVCLYYDSNVTVDQRGVRLE